jgi:7-keto-8-aminopelargonate synthetase-like enzyme
VTETVFSMDGDRVPVDALAVHLRRGGLAYLDEAHAFGLFPGGRGLLGTLDPRPPVIVCTLGKAAGCSGAFVAGSAALAELVRACARSFVFTTSVSPAAAIAVVRALALLRGAEGDELRARLWRNAALLGAELGEPDPPSPIFPLLVGENARALALSSALLARGWHVQPIRPPTVPFGTARLRITVSATHDPSDLLRFAQDLRTLLRDVGLPLRLARRTTPFDQAGDVVSP